MKKKFVLLLITLTCYVSAKLINLNPDPDGIPWYAGETSIPTAEQQKIIDTIPELILPEHYKYKNTELPYMIDNSLLPYFRPVIYQQGESCAQATSIGYIYTYEQNFMNGTDANITHNQYPTHYTYNFLNGGDPDNGSVFYQGWEIAQAGGIPDVVTYGGMWPSDDTDTMTRLWMNGFDKYKTAMYNRKIEQISINVATPEGLDILKQWFNDHCDGSGAGGIVLFSAGAALIEWDRLQEDSFCTGEYVIIKWDKDVNHSMTLVGYNDSIRWDYNNDGRYTNDLDITGDGHVDMRDWEIGGLRMVNSWGESWADDGKAWVMYRTLALDYTEGGIFNGEVFSIKATETNTPELILRTTIDYNERNDIKLIAGISQDQDSQEPDYYLEFPYFRYQGGDSIGMSGVDNIIELGLDVSDMLDNITKDSAYKVFLCIEQKQSNSDRGEGNIEEFSIIDNYGTEFISEDKHVEILRDSISYASVIIPQKMSITTDNLPSALTDTEYSYTLEAEKGTFPYQWDMMINYSEISNVTPFPDDSFTKLNMPGNDDDYANLDLDFAFPFYNKLYNTITVTTNGAITFNGIYEDVKTIEDVYNTKTIAACAADFKLFKNDGIFYYGNEDYMVVYWKTSIKYTDYGSYTLNAEYAVKLYPDGKIQIYYRDFDFWLKRITGISNGTESSAFISNISYSGNPVNLKTTFVTQPYPFGIELNDNGVLSGYLLPTNQTEWDLTIKVTDSNGLEDVKDLVLTLADPTAVLTPPLSVNINRTESSSILNWEEVQGAALYRIYRSNEPYNGFIQIGTSTSLIYEDSAILPDNKYFYYVTADNSVK